MRVLIDGHMLGTNEGGNETYVKNLSREMTKIKGVDLRILTTKAFSGDSKEDKELRNLCVQYEHISNISRLLYHLPRLALKYKIDIIHSTYVSPFYKNTKSVVMIHDFAFKRYPQFFSSKELLVFKTLLPLSLARADAIIVPSYFSKQEAIKFYPQYQEKIFVTHEAAGDNFKPINHKEARRLLFKKHNISPPFLLTLNNKNPKKNINRTIQSFLSLLWDFPKLKLVIIGDSANINKEYLVKDEVILLENIPDKDLILFYNRCELFIYNSLYEGFGLPLLEALQCKTAVIASDISAHREITKNSLVYANPLNYHELYNKMRILLTDGQFKRKIQQQGYKIARTFDWQKTAEATAKVYEHVLKGE